MTCIRPDDGDADPGVTVSPVVASWQICGALNGNCKLYCRAGKYDIMMILMVMTMTILRSMMIMSEVHLSLIVVASKEKDKAGKPGFSCMLIIIDYK